MALAAANFVLVAWDGEEPSWSILRSSACTAVDGHLAVGRKGEALWGKEKFPCELLAIAGVLKHSIAQYMVYYKIIILTLYTKKKTLK